MRLQYGLLDVFYLAKTIYDCALNCINSAVELVTIKSERTRHCYGSEARFTDGESGLCIEF